MLRPHPFLAIKDGSLLDKGFENFRRVASLLVSLSIVAALVWLGSTYKTRDERVWMADARQRLDSHAMTFLGKQCPPMGGGAEAGRQTSFMGADSGSASELVRLANAFAATIDVSDASLEDKVRVAMVRMQYESAARYAEEAVAAARKLKDARDDRGSAALLVDALCLRARALAASGDRAGAAECFREAAELSTALEDPAISAQIKRQLAFVLCCIRKGGLAPWRDERVLEEEAALRLSLDYDTRHGSPSEYIPGCVRLACLLYARAQSAPSPYREELFGEAVSLFRESLAFKGLNHSTASIAREWLALSLCCLAEDADPVAAARLLDEAAALFPSHSGEEKGIALDSPSPPLNVEGMMAFARARLEVGQRRAELLALSATMLRNSLEHLGPGGEGMRRVTTIVALGQSLCAAAAEDAGANQARLYWEAGMALSEASVLFSREVSPERWARLHYLLGLSICRFGEIANDSVRLAHGIEVLEEVLETCRDTHPALCVAVRIELSAARARAANVNELRDIATELDDMLASADMLPSVRAECRRTQGEVLSRLAGMLREGEAASLLDLAIAANADACTYFTRETSRSNWARMRMEAGELYVSRAVLEPDLVAVDAMTAEAVNACLDALSVFSWENAPSAWTRSQRVLGRVYCLRSEIARAPEDRQAHLVRAIDALRDSLSGPSEGDDLEVRARTRMLLATALRMDASQSPRARHASAIEQIEKALEYFTRDTHPVEWAAAQSELGLNLMLSPRSDAPRNAPDYPAAASAFRRALEVHTREAFPDKWASGMQRLGECLFAQIRLPADDEIHAIVRETRDVIKELLRSPELLTIDERRHVLEQIVSCCAIVAHFAVDDNMASTDELLRFSAMRCAAMEGSEGFLQAMVDHGARLVHAAYLTSGDDVRRRVAIAVAHYRELLVLLDDPSAEQVRTQSAPGLADSLGTLSWLQTLVYRDFAGAEDSARRAFTLCPQKRWILINLAHALLLSGQSAEAEAIFRENALSIVGAGRVFGAVCIEDFASLRDAGIVNPELDRMEAVIREILQGAQ